MKKFFTILIVFAAALFFVSCQKERETLSAESLLGCWHLSSIDGDPVGTKSFSDVQGLSVWIEFKADSFDLYQRADENVSYTRYSGTWSLAGKVLSGKYSDGTPWSSTYEVALSGDTLTLKSPTEEQVYHREPMIR